MSLSCRNNLLVVFCAMSVSVVAQNTPINLVPNGGFENHTSCPTTGSGVSTCEDWYSQIPSVDHFHMCGSSLGDVPNNKYGFQLAVDSGYIGLSSYTPLFAGSQEVAAAELISELVQGVKYRVRFKVSYADTANYAVCCIGAFLASTPPSSGPYSQNFSSVELIIPEEDFDTSIWFQFDGVFTASGGEDRIFLGTFRPDSEMNPVNVRPFGDANYDFAYFYIDDVEVYEDDLVDATDEAKVEVGILSNLVSENMEVSTDRNLSLQLLDISGRAVLVEKLQKGKTVVNISGVPNGMYVAMFSENGRYTTSQKVVVLH